MQIYLGISGENISKSVKIGQNYGREPVASTLQVIDRKKVMRTDVGVDSAGTEAARPTCRTAST